jgi:hypothetical protein
MTNKKFIKCFVYKNKFKPMRRPIIRLKAIFIPFLCLFIFYPFNLHATPKFLTLPLKLNAKVVNGWYYSHPPNPVDKIHRGIDYEATYDQEIVAAADGVAMTSSQYANGEGYGKFVLIKHEETNDNGEHYFTLYAHINRAVDKIKTYPETQKDNTDYTDWTFVERGEVIAYVGKEDAEWTHLHFEVNVGGYALNKKDPYDLYKLTTETVNSADYYPPYGSLYTSCGTNHLWLLEDVLYPSVWGYYCIHCVHGLGIIPGYPDNTFKPKKPVKRAEFIEMVILALERIEGRELFNYCMQLPTAWNVDTGEWYYLYLMKAYMYTNNNVNPSERIAFWDPDIPVDFSEEITRQEAAHIVRNALRLPTSNIGSYELTDVPACYYAPWVYDIWKIEIMNGFVEKNFNPLHKLKRAEAANIIRNILKYKGYFIYIPNSCNLYPDICNYD